MKARRRMLKNIHDIAGIRITCPFVSDIYTLYELLKPY
ncbi:hypothetical protein HUG20_01165 [Salicibibacter cibi]|uniref:RelA/SpoT domain-containing protein n=1 Tax=Salicibibacter cibi TaxID=2743001 RepID=A0A7T7CE50_9BACI|nr:hypothetical protein HUG20_01165 [Salicibibacter cibi]